MSYSYLIAIISNQAGIALKSDSKAPKAHQARLTAFKSKVSAVFSQLDLPISIYAATEKDLYRKPRTGMWKELLEDYDLSLPGSIDLENSFFVGDAGGRIGGVGLAKDFSSSDRYSIVICPVVIEYSHC
jgi:bifunctional polynucleotide phosphatase/kinase